MRNSKVNGRICFLFLGVRCCMPSKSNTVVPKSQVSFPLSALHKRVCANLCHCLLSPDLRNIRDMSWMHFIYVWLSMVTTVLRTCHNKLNCTFNWANKASCEFTFKFSIVSGVDVLDNQGSSPFNFNSSFVRWRNIRMFLDTTIVSKNHSDICTIYQNSIDNALNIIMWISVVPHQVGITTIVKEAWTRRFMGEMHTHTP